MRVKLNVPNLVDLKLLDDGKSHPSASVVPLTVFLFLQLISYLRKLIIHSFIF